MNNISLGIALIVLGITAITIWAVNKGSDASIIDIATTEQIKTVSSTHYGEKND